MAGLIDTDSGLEFGTGLVWLAGGIGQAGLVITSSTSGAALFLAEWGPYGMDMDFTDASIAIDDSTGVLDYNSQGTVSSTTGALLGPGSKLTYSAPSLKFTEQADGYIAGQAHNIALYSEDFTNAAWVVANCTKSGTAEVTITLSAGTAGKYLGQTIAVVSGAPYNYSFEAKAGTHSIIQVANNGDTNAYVNFNLSTGAVGTAGSAAAGTITDVGSGYYRCSVTWTSASLGNSQRVYAVDSTSSAYGASTASTGTFVFRKGHFRRTPSVSTYVKTTTASVYDLPYVYSSGVKTGIFPEPAATNLALWGSNIEITHALTVTGGSGTFTNGETVTATGGGTGVYQSSTSTSTVFTLRTGSGTFTGTLTGGTSGATRTISSAALIWTPSNLTTAKTATGPDGVANSASTLTATAGNATALQAITSGSSSRLTHCYIKRRTGTGNIDLTQDNGSTWATVTVTSAWTRVEIAAVTSTNPTVGIRVVTSGDAVDVAYFQHETGTVATSPIITYGGTGLRVVDTDTSLLNLFPSLGSAYTMYIRYKPASASVATTALRLDDTTANELVSIGNNASGQGIVTVTDGGVPDSTTSGTITSSAFHRIAVSVEANNVLLVVNGGAAAQDTGVTLPTLTRMLLGNTSGQLIAQLALLPGARTEAQLQAIGA